MLALAGAERVFEMIDSPLEADEGEALRIKEDENSGVRWFAPEAALSASSEPWMVEHIYKKLAAKVK